jgi:hypothetical protein
MREPIALPSALITVRPRRLSPDSRIGSFFVRSTIVRSTIVRSTIVVPADQRLLVARIAIDDAARHEAARVHPLQGCRRSASAPQYDEDAPEREREHTETLQNRHSDPQRCKMLAAVSEARSAWFCVTWTIRATMDDVDQGPRPLQARGVT